MEKKYVYLPMPVSFDVKREWNAKGYKVVDAQFMPDGYENPTDEPKQESKPKRKTAK